MWNFVYFFLISRNNAHSLKCKHRKFSFFIILWKKRRPRESCIVNQQLCDLLIFVVFFLPIFNIEHQLKDALCTWINQTGSSDCFVDRMSQADAIRPRSTAHWCKHRIISYRRFAQFAYILVAFISSWSISMQQNLCAGMHAKDRLFQLIYGVFERWVHKFIQILIASH